MKILKAIALLFIAVLFIGGLSCKKYPDGPLINLDTKMHRIAGKVSKSWDVVYFSIDGYDSTNYLKSQPLYGKYYFEHVGKDGRSVFYYSNGTSYGTNGNWEFVNNKNGIHISSQSYVQSTHFNLGPYAADYEVWEIQRLTEKDLWLKCSYGGKEYFVKFKH